MKPRVKCYLLGAQFCPCCRPGLLSDKPMRCPGCGRMRRGQHKPSCPYHGSSKR